ncbi:hypothetical protein LX32DRAFT_243565 [Colletotrichum zoysiae]|uniref:Uncharacterized protein n=1 Tax=Colletotrichum zoysiae TaxID=1216348 RepID=A0AAD9HML2_9PEZI|nr:hypothetical protein LX32DRAFT_243565 [Colletotrichum zoysiae]
MGLCIWYTNDGNTNHLSGSEGPWSGAGCDRMVTMQPRTQQLPLPDECPGVGVHLAYSSVHQVDGHSQATGSMYRDDTLDGIRTMPDRRFRFVSFLRQRTGSERPGTTFSFWHTGTGRRFSGRREERRDHQAWTLKPLALRTSERKANNVIVLAN